MLANRVSASQAIDFLHLVQNLKVSRTGALTCMLALCTVRFRTDMVSRKMLIGRVAISCPADNKEDGVDSMQCEGARKHCRPHVQDGAHEPHLWSRRGQHRQARHTISALLHGMHNGSPGMQSIKAHLFMSPAGA